MRTIRPLSDPLAAVFAVGLLLATGAAEARIAGIAGPTFQLTARTGHITVPDGAQIFMWGYADGDGGFQYPGPTLIVNQGDVVAITLRNELPESTSIVFPGQSGVTSDGGVPGTLAQEALPGGGTVTYTFTANRPGTFLYHSGSRPDLQIEMGLVGALIVRPTDGSGAVVGNQAYSHPDSAFDREFLMLVTEIDPDIHVMIQYGLGDLVDTADRWSVYWFVNGRAAPDTMLPDFTPWLPEQPYGAMIMMHPGDKVLFRQLGGGFQSHPLHHHGNHSRVIARDGVPLASGPGVGSDLGHDDFTHTSLPGETLDSIYTWTGHGLGWDVYGHAPGDPLVAGEDPADHGKPLPVQLPNPMDLTFGEMWGGSPFLGAVGPLPPGTVTSSMGGFYFMYHSHTEKEMVNNNVFPGGLMTMIGVEHPDMMIHEDHDMMAQE